MVTVRAYDHERDLAAVQRIWREVGWVDEDPQVEAVGTMFAAGDAVVAEIDGEAECAVHRTPGTLRHGDAVLALSAITAVTTSHVGRKQGLASHLMVEALAGAHDDGAAVSALGMFEQGFYDRFGFGAGTYNHRITYDPATFTVPVPERPPVRLGVEDAAEIHALLQRRHQVHGAVTLDPVAIVESELAFIEKRWALGYRAGDGRLTSFVAGSMSTEHRYRVDWLAYETPGDLLEILGLLRALGDQLTALEFSFEPPEIQLQDLVRSPIRQRNKAPAVPQREAHHDSLAWWQVRIMDVERCLSTLSWPGAPIEFDLEVGDPLADLGGRWSGAGGTYNVRIADRTVVERGGRGAPVLTASVGALSRWWLGVRPASSLALTDHLAGPPELLADLDRAVRLPQPNPGWIF